MSLFSFVKEAGEKLLDLLHLTNAPAQLKKHLANAGLDDPSIQLVVEGDKVIVSGEVATQEQKEKVLLAVGNTHGIKHVEDRMTVHAAAPQVAQARFVTVKAGDTLSSIAKAEYGDSGKYTKIFEANKPLLSHPDKIYPGQVLRIPQ
ncbi:nucleoid-associated protein YgaU [Pseudomonas sp. JUb42]|uniref:peptidoglycan-binding protein LysM n=1 Tax=Pseudomonas sp. JUb42 TaxID=2940611 RepID=UPI002168FAB0|nr:peptidoglycan-binding protein LysM [Pseudomonas sp. JUb42]MCS3469300.1 nucleoid-associated protein YgaU [Pseudomonas sp. JUb42]